MAGAQSESAAGAICFRPNSSPPPSGLKIMKQNTMFLFVGAACVALGAAGYWLYQEQNRSGVEVSVGGRSITIETR